MHRIGPTRSTVAAPAPTPHCAVRACTPVPESGAYSHVSFAIVPIQLPIVPPNLFCSHPLHTNAARKRAAPTDPPWLRAAAAQCGAQTLQVRQLAELRRQRAIQAVPFKAPATARGRIGSIEALVAPTSQRAAPCTTQRT